MKCFLHLLLNISSVILRKTIKSVTYMNDKIKARITVGNNKNVYGSLETKDESYIFNSWSCEDFTVSPRSNLYGKTHDSERISLLDCIGNKYSYSRNNEFTYGSEIYPFIIVTGIDYVNPNADKFESITMSAKNPEKLIIILNSFGYINSPSKKLIDALKEMKTTPNFEDEYHPVIAYYNGKNNILTQETKLGLINIRNNISYDMGGKPSGVEIKNDLSVTIYFKTKVDIEEALSRANKIALFLRFIGGEGLFFDSISIRKENCKDIYGEFKVHDSSNCWGKDLAETENKFPLIDIANKNFLMVLKSWFDKEDRDEARYKFYDTFFNKDYTSERLVNAANMFDFLPKLSTKRQTLKSRINERLVIIENQLNKRNISRETLDFIVDNAIKARRYFVHGTKHKKLSINQIYSFIPLFIDTLEYIYAISELVEAGLNIDTIEQQSRFHKVSEYELVINSQYEILESAINKNSTA